MKNNKDLYLSSFYMPHRNVNGINNLDSSIKKPTKVNIFCLQGTSTVQTLIGIHSDVKPIYNKQKPRRVYLFSKANWEGIKKACVQLSDNIITTVKDKENIEELWNTFKNGIQEAMDKYIPSKIFKKKKYCSLVQ